LIAGGVGLAGVAAGAVFGGVALADNNQASSDCFSGVCNEHGYNATNDAKHAATVSTVAFAVGGGLVAAGLVLWLTAPSEPRSTGARAAVVPFASADAGGAMIRGSF
jgi:hypothetical protein